MLSVATTTMTMKMMFIALLSGAGPFFSPNPSETSEDFGGGREKKQIPLYPATCVLSFRVKCCCLLALQERERVKKKNTVEVCILRMCIIFQRRTSCIRKSRKRVLKKGETGGNGNPPSVNKENSSCRFFSCYDRRLGRCPPLFCFCFISFSLSFSLFFPRGGKGG